MLKGWLSPTEQELKANQRMWAQEFEERYLDLRMFFDIQADELPEYHYWSKDQNPKVKPKFMTPLQQEHHTDMSTIPRFFPNGHAKVPLAANQWHVPLDKDGRFDWRANERKNHPRPFLHKDRFPFLFERYLFQAPWLWLSIRIRGLDDPQRSFHLNKEHKMTGNLHFYRHRQLPFAEKWFYKYGSASNEFHYKQWGYSHLMMLGVFTVTLSAHYRMNSWISQTKYAQHRRYRDRGNFHDLLL